MVPVPIAGANCENEGPEAPEWLILVPGRAGVCGEEKGTDNDALRRALLFRL